MIEARLRQHGILPTVQRMRIAEVLFACRQHISADQLMDALRERGESVSKATVYNTLGLFVRKGLLREVSIDPARVFYDSNLEPHHHYYDTETGELTDIPVDEVRLEKLPPLPDDMEVEGVDVVVRVRRRRKSA